VRSSPAALDDRRFDVVVVDGGLAAAALTRTLARGGARVALVAPGDPAADPALGSIVLAGDLPLERPEDLDALLSGRADLAGGRQARSPRSASVRETLLRATPHLVRPLPMTLRVAHDATESVLERLRQRRRAVEDSTLPAPRVLSVGRAGSRSSEIELFEASIDRLRVAVAMLQDAADAGAILVGACRPGTRIGRTDAADACVFVDATTHEEVRVGARFVVEQHGASARFRVRRRRGRAVDAARVRVGGDSSGWGRETVVLAAVAGRGVWREVFASGDERPHDEQADIAIETPLAGDDPLAVLPWSFEPSPAPALVRAERLAGELLARLGLAPPAPAAPGRWRAAFAFLPGGRPPHDPFDPRTARLGSQAVEILVRAGADPSEEALLRAEVEFARARLGAWTLTECAARLGVSPEDAALAAAFRAADDGSST
jgi:hypothetical protein